jgi:hypothetical protein
MCRTPVGGRGDTPARSAVSARAAIIFADILLPFEPWASGLSLQKTKASFLTHREMKEWRS